MRNATGVITVKCSSACVVTRLRAANDESDAIFERMFWLMDVKMDIGMVTLRGISFQNQWAILLLILSHIPPFASLREKIQEQHYHYI